MDNHSPTTPEWWAPYTHEFPDWQAWEGVGGIKYALLPRSSPPIVLSDTNPVLLAARIRTWYEGRQR
jgi:hypothetical protein